jgi:Hyaluronidase
MKRLGKLSRIFRSTVAAVLISFSFLVPEAQADPGKCLRVFDATAYVGKPDLASRGIEMANVFEPDRWWPQRGPDDLPDQSASQEWIRRIRMRQGLLVLDLERWWLRGSDAVVSEAMRRYMTVADWIRAAGYSDPMGYYGVIPTYNPASALQSADSSSRAAWRKENDRVQPLADRVDMLFPSLYTSDEDVGKWERLAVATLQEARRLARGKPVYPFLWPQYEGTNTPLSLKYLPKSQWARELEVIGNNASGVVIWGGIAPAAGSGSPPWDESAPWWQATVEFMARHPLCSGPR